jgi:hypothetical protein
LSSRSTCGGRLRVRDGAGSSCGSVWWCYDAHIPMQIKHSTRNESVFDRGRPRSPCEGRWPTCRGWAPWPWLAPSAPSVSRRSLQALRIFRTRQGRESEQGPKADSGAVPVRSHPLWECYGWSHAHAASSFVLAPWSETAQSLQRLSQCASSSTRRRRRRSVHSAAAHGGGNARPIRTREKWQRPWATLARTGEVDLCDGIPYQRLRKHRGTHVSDVHPLQMHVDLTPTPTPPAASLSA